MYCPKCLAEYEEGFTECADCQVALVSGHAPQPTKEPEVELVTVLETGEPIALSLAKASLDEGTSRSRNRFRAGVAASRHR